MKQLLLHFCLWIMSKFKLKDEMSRILNSEQAGREQAGREQAGREELAPKRVNIFQDTLLSGWFNSDTNELFKGFSVSSEDVVLDVGCGDSPFLSFCAERGADIIFADIDEGNVEATFNKLKGTKARSLKPIVSDANPLPLEDATASKVIAMEVMEHVDDPVVFLSELVRVGRPGAMYLLTVPDSVAENLQANGLAPDSYFKKPNHVRVIGRDEFQDMVESSGLVVESREFYGFYWSMWWMFFWVCKQDLSVAAAHPLLASWTSTWEELLTLDGGEEVKHLLDNFMPKSQAIIARKPLE